MYKEVPLVTAEDVSYTVSKMTGIPLYKLEQTESERLLHMEEALHERIVGQDEAIKSVSKAIRRSRAGLKTKTDQLVRFSFSVLLELERPSLQKFLQNLCLMMRLL